MRIRASDLAAMFEVYMIAVGLGALTTAFGTTGPWYDGPATFWAYFASFLGGLVLLGVLLLSAIILIRTTPAEFPPQGSTSSGGSAAMTSKSDAADPDMEKLMQSLERAAVRETKQGTTTLLETPEIRVASTAAAPTVEGRVQRRYIVAALIGPIVTATLFTAVSAALLPASDGMLQTEFPLNTFVILVLAYGWGGLVAYTVASLLLVTHES